MRPHACEIPNVLGLTLDEALCQLRQTGLSVTVKQTKLLHRRLAATELRVVRTSLSAKEVEVVVVEARSWPKGMKPPG